MTIKTLLIANRGEIACRIARTARAFGIEPVGVHSDADATAKHVRDIGKSIHIGGSAASESYLNIEKVLAAAKQAGADAIHPGYGFLSENPEFANAVEEAGLIFMGPTAETLIQFGDKARAKEAAIAAGVPVIPGSDKAYDNPAEIETAVKELGLPVLLKASAGGGGRGQRLVTSMQTLSDDIEAALREAESAFGRSDLLLERQITGARHIEIQIAGDGAGNVIHLFERDCSLQRRHQKVIEEAPAAGLDRAFLSKIADDAVRLGKSLNYRGLGTVEFLVSEDEYFFLEVNPRLQVEHPVTEAVTGLDLVALQLSIAIGKGLDLDQSDVTLTGHAVEARLYAEDPEMQFAPATGQISDISLSKDIRIDSGVEAGDSFTPFYDPMIAKLIAHGVNREDALSKLSEALKNSHIDGLVTNKDFLQSLIEVPAVQDLDFHTRMIDESLDDILANTGGQNFKVFAIAGCLWGYKNRDGNGGDLWLNDKSFTGWRSGLGEESRVSGIPLSLTCVDIDKQVVVSPLDGDDCYLVSDENKDNLVLKITSLGESRWQVTIGNEVLMVSTEFAETSLCLKIGSALYHINVASTLENASAGEGADNQLLSPLTGAIIKILSSDGDQVAAGDTVVILESMKMEISVKAPLSGKVDGLCVSIGAMVDRGQVLAEINPV
ncbi:ATP-grasp domain-containing protein [Sneathiella sp. P13V-1]|uniref:acetyl/propionyl/methylcrotonyl-CoA carboxylase subunit alpha n=1 Tax=Sneathiella sp. P13V-1 TaxID=2697366 RepID=UPI00187B7964|nr:biotin carboxylase N-terminal domain-containing protein [Sneathiella sp. P13V-1]MBE7637483.1 ATP-grasp domain-containing protein [Sneathiella sp. P13V-1]